MQSWNVTTLGEIAEVQSGGTPLRSHGEYWAGDIPWYSSGELNEIFTKAPKDFITLKGIEESNAKLFPKDSLLIGMYDTAALKMSILDRDAAFNQAIAGVKPNENIDLKFILYSVNSRRFEILNQRRGVRQKNLSLAKIKNIALPIPALSEQKRIVSIVDQAFEGIDRAIANTQKNLTNARELFESYLNAIFTQKGDGWAEKPIHEISDIVSGYSFKSSDFSTSNTLKSIKITNVGVREFIRESSSYLPAIFATTYSKFAIPENSLVIALTRSIISTGLKVAMVPSDYHCALLNQRVAALKVDSSLMSRQFLFSYLCTTKVVDYVQSQVNTLMQPNLSINDLRNMLVPVPLLEEQNQIVLGIEALSTETQRLEAIYRQKLAALTELKQSILQKAFTGELTADTTNQATKTAKEVIAA